MAAPYVCTLDEATVRKAEKELYEDPKNRQGAIDTFREWIKQQKHIECPTDDVFLLGFLRGKHFSQLEAREALERFMIHRDKMAMWTKGLDTKADEIDDIIDSSVMLMLPDRDDNGQRVMIFRPGNIDPGNKTVFTAFIRLFVILSYYNFFCDEMTQVHGITFFSDWMGHTMANEMKVPMEFKKHMVTLLSKAFPARVKAIHMCNAGHLLEFLMSIVTSIMPDNLKDRLHVHHHGLETVYSYVPKQILPDDYLPDDYTGPSAGSIDKLKDFMKATIQQPEVRERIKYLSSDKFFINIKDKDTDVAPASFRKLNTE